LLLWLTLSAAAPAVAVVAIWILRFTGVLSAWASMAIGALLFLLPIVSHLGLTRPIPLAAREEPALAEGSVARQVARWAGFLWCIPAGLCVAAALLPWPSPEVAWLGAGLHIVGPLTVQTAVVVLTPMVRSLSAWLVLDRAAAIAQVARIAAALGIVATLVSIPDAWDAGATPRITGCSMLVALFTMAAPACLMVSIGMLAANAPSIVMIHYQRRGIEDRLRDEAPD